MTASLPLSRIGGALTATALSASLALWWRRRQRQLNTEERVYVSLAPRLRAEAETCRFWERVPASYIQRGLLDAPCAHVSMEIGGSREQALYSFTAPVTLFGRVWGELEREWPEVAIRQLLTEEDAALAEDALYLNPLGQIGRDELAVDPVRQGDEDDPCCWRTFKLAAPDHLAPIETPARAEGWRSRGGETASPLAGLLSALQFPAGTVGGIQVLVRPAPVLRQQWWAWQASRLRQLLANRGSHSQTRVQEGELGTVRQSRSRQVGPVNADALQDELARLKERLAGPLYEVCLRVWARGPQAEGEVSRLSDRLIAAARSPWNHLVVDKAGTDPAPVLGRHFPVTGRHRAHGAGAGAAAAPAQ